MNCMMRRNDNERWWLRNIDRCSVEPKMRCTSEYRQVTLANTMATGRHMVWPEYIRNKGKEWLRQINGVWRDEALVDGRWYVGPVACEQNQFDAPKRSNVTVSMWVWCEREGEHVHIRSIVDESEREGEHVHIRSIVDERVIVFTCPYIFVASEKKINIDAVLIMDGTSPCSGNWISMASRSLRWNKPMQWKLN